MCNHTDTQRESACTLLVNDHYGIYSAQRLAEVYVLYVEANGTYDSVNSDDLAILAAGPAYVDEAEYDASSDYFEVYADLESNGLYVCFEGPRVQDHTFYRVASMDGGIFAIHPDAVWSDDDDQWIMP